MYVQYAQYIKYVCTSIQMGTNTQTEGGRMHIDCGELVKAMKRLRKVCGNSLSKKVNPEENVCTASSTSHCDMSVCPVLIRPLTWILNKT